MPIYQQLSDSELVIFLREGDAAAYTEIYGRYAGELYQFTYRKIGEKEATGDLIQDLFTQVWLKRKKLNFENELKPYLYRAIKNRICNHYRNTKTTDLFMDRFKHYGNTITNQTDFLLRHNYLSQIIKEEVEALPLKMKEVYKLSREEHLSRKEVAEVLDISEKNVEMRLYRATVILKARLKRFMLF